MTPETNSDLALHHVGYVVPDIASSIHNFALSTASTWDGVISEDPHQNVKVAFLTTRAADAQIELVEPASPASPVAGFLQKGGGLHHLCYEVNDLELELANFRKRRALIVKRPKPAVAFNGRRIAWLLTSEKLLIELLEREAR